MQADRKGIAASDVADDLLHGCWLPLASGGRWKAFRTHVDCAIVVFAMGGTEHRETHHSLSRQFRVGHSTVNQLIEETCVAIYLELKAEFLKSPKTREDWSAVIQDFKAKWQFPNCVGAVDGKDVCIIKPKTSGSLYFNYKKTFSIVLFALVDANYRFRYLDIGAPGSEGDGGIWQSTPLQQAIDKKKAGLPKAVKVATTPELHLPPVIVGDDAFPLGKNSMKPFGGDSFTQGSSSSTTGYPEPAE
ncbi:hypothetical protein MTO96_027975 [Rhipicephalus appendiculatus]